MSWSAVSGTPAAAVVITAVDVPCVPAVDGVSAVGVPCCCWRSLLFQLSLMLLSGLLLMYSHPCCFFP
jgi:hypothetical protein